MLKRKQKHERVEKTAAAWIVPPERALRIRLEVHFLTRVLVYSLRLTTPERKDFTHEERFELIRICYYVPHQ